MRYYAVANGRCTGIYTDPQEYLQQIHQYKNACAKSFSRLEDAERFMAAHKRFPSSFSHIKKALSLGEGPYCYVDFEYTCRNERPKECKNHGVELLSVGAVIRNASDQTVGQYYSLIRPLNNRTLSDYCKALTGLRQEEIDAARDSIAVLREFFAYCQSLGVTDYLNFGCMDRAALTFDLEDKPADDILREQITRLKDVQECLDRQLLPPSLPMHLSLSDLKIIFGLPKDVAHNALADALDLADILSIFAQGGKDVAILRTVIAKRRKKFILSMTPRPAAPSTGQSDTANIPDSS